MAVPEDPPAGVEPGGFQDWAQDVSDTVQDHEARLLVGEAHSGGRELGIAVIETDVTSSGSAIQDVTGLVVTAEVGDAPIKIVAGIEWQSATAGGATALAFYEDTTSLRSWTQTLTVTERYVPHFEYRLAPTPGFHTYKVRIDPVTSGVVTLYAGSFIQVVEV